MTLCISWLILVSQLTSPVCVVVVSMLLPCVAEELLSHIGAHWLVIAIKAVHVTYVFHYHAVLIKLVIIDLVLHYTRALFALVICCALRHMHWKLKWNWFFSHQKKLHMFVLCTHDSSL